MTRKIYCGLAILIVLHIGVSAVLLMRNTDTEPITIDRDDTEPLNPNPTLNTKDNPLPAEPEDEPQNETVSSEEAGSDYVWTIEKLQRLREFELAHLPEQIAALKELVEGYEETINQFSEAYHNPPNGRPGPIIKQHYEFVKEQLPHKRGMLSRQQEEFKRLSQPDGLEYLISSMGLEEELSMEADNEK